MITLNISYVEWIMLLHLGIWTGQAFLFYLFSKCRHKDKE